MRNNGIRVEFCDLQKEDRIWRYERNDLAFLEWFEFLLEMKLHFILNFFKNPIALGNFIVSISIQIEFSKYLFCLQWFSFQMKANGTFSKEISRLKWVLLKNTSAEMGEAKTIKIRNENVSKG